MPFGLDARAARVTWTVLVILAALGLLYALRSALLLVVFAGFFAYLLWPVVNVTQRRLRLRSRTLAIALVYVVLIGVLAGAGAALGPRLTSEARNLAEKIPKTSAQLGANTIVGETLQRYGWSPNAIRMVETQIRNHAGDMVAYAQSAMTRALSWLAGAWVIVLIPIFAFFILKDADRITAVVTNLLTDASHRRRWLAISEDLHHLLGEYVRALFLLALITTTVWSIVFLIAGVPSAVVLAVLGGALEFIPLLGPLVAGILVVTVAMFTGYGHLLLLVGFVVFWRFVQDYVSSPLVMGRGVEMHPAVVIFGVIAGGELAGPAGMFLSVPVMAGARILWRHGRAARERAREERTASRG
jgi:predicted PurR-regulated permease PerM